MALRKPAPWAGVQAGVRIPMDGRGRWMDNVFIERLWRSLKYELALSGRFEARATPSP
jgi:hypothetical protein